MAIKGVKDAPTKRLVRAVAPQPQQRKIRQRMHDEKAPPAARVAAANALLDRGYGKPTQPISQTLAKVDPSSISDEELAAIAINGVSVNAQAH
jgi:hypothetical protein